MKNNFLDLNSYIQELIREEVNRQLGTYNAAQALGAENSERKPESDLYMDVEELSKITGLAKQSIYGMRCRRELPAYKFGRELRFNREEIQKWMESKRLFTIEEGRGI